MPTIHNLGKKYAHFTMKTSIFNLNSKKSFLNYGLV